MIFNAESNLYLCILHKIGSKTMNFLYENSQSYI